MKLAAHRQQQTNQTNLKLPVNHPHILPTRDKMKFSWRANWEILLVFVIIFVGIVITTIAAIRSKDKHLLVATEESAADFASGIVDASSSLQVPPLPQTDFQMQNGHLATGQDALDAAPPATRRPSRSSTPTPQNGGYRGDRKRSHPASSSSSIDVVRPANVAEAIVAQPAKSAQHFANQQRQHHPSASNQNSYMTSGAGRQHDNYEAMSTEQTPSQTSMSNSDGERPYDSPQQAGPKQSSDARRSESKQQRNLREPDPFSSDFNDQLESDGGKVRAGTGQHHLTMQGPYELSSLQNGLRAQTGPASRNSHAKFGQDSVAKMDQMPTSQAPLAPTMLDPEDMMTSYTRAPQNQLNLTEALLRGDFSSSSASFGGNKTAPPEDTLANEFGNQLAGSSAASSSSGGGQTLISPAAHRPFANLPFAMLLHDLMKLSRPPQQPLIDSQASLEQPANTRPQYGILQQLRALPGPLLALFQHAGNSQGGDHVQNYQLANHDTSESNDHYHRISMTPYNDLNAIVSRSLRTTNPLPAFPAPKGVPQIWVPANMGGLSVLHEAASSNADFVASETAGFVRGASIASNGGGMQAAASSQQEQVAVDGSTGQNQQPANDANSKQQSSNAVGSGQPQANPSAATNQNSVNNNGNIAQPSSTAQVAAVGPSGFAPAQANSEIAQQSARAPSAQIVSVPSSVTYNNAPAAQQNHLQLLQQRAQQRSDGNGASLFRPAQSQLGSSLIRQSANAAPIANMRQAIQSKFPSSHAQNQQPIQLNGINRVRRSTRSYEGASGQRDMADERDEEEYLDSGPVSIVRPDGRPMVGDLRTIRKQRLISAADDEREARPTVLAQASSQRQVNHADLNESALRHYVGHENGHDATGGRDGQAAKHRASIGDKLREDRENQLANRKRNQQKLAASKRPKLSGRNKHKKLSPSALQLDAAGSGLMSKLLGVASTNDELEDDLDGDDDESANERRKEELEDAEFGIVNDDRSNVPNSPSDGSNSNDLGDGAQDNNDVSRLTHDGAHMNQEARHDEMPPIRSAGTTDSNAYARRNQQQQQQRSDVEFYGHPGEETRQLKYGILGSGNYEVVNGGIYPDVEESTAAVNSVANYVRKPGGLLSGFPKLMSATGFVDEARQTELPLAGDGRGGFMRGASAARSAGMIGLFPPHPSLAFNKLAGLNNPLLDVLDAAHVAGPGYFDPNLVSQLGGSGTSTRTTHASRDQDPSTRGDETGLGEESHDAKRKRKPTDKSQPAKGNYSPRGNEQMATMETLNDANNQIKSSSSGAQQPSGRKMNQFYSYHILPSKKVTIFSDQDLDSAPDDQTGRATFMRPDWT